MKIEDLINLRNMLMKQNQNLKQTLEKIELNGSAYDLSLLDDSETGLN